MLVLAFASPTAKRAVGETEAGKESALAGYLCLNNDFSMKHKFEGSIFVFTWIILLLHVISH